MKRKSSTVGAALLALSLTACSQPGGPGYGMGPGATWGGYGPGHGMGPGTMDGGYGPMGLGMMGGGYGMGPGMMGGYGYVPNLTPEQRFKLYEIQQEFAKTHWSLMEAMHSQGGPMARSFGAGATNEKAAREAYDAMAAVHKQMFETSLQMRERMEAVLTEEQREQMHKYWRGGWSGRGQR